MEIMNYINGSWVKPIVTEYFDVINPATEKDLTGFRRTVINQVLPRSQKSD
jgi:acyl-CoA reductase-like NAD-dependent aldehyde dehydrogenase